MLQALIISMSINIDFGLKNYKAYFNQFLTFFYIAVLHAIKCFTIYHISVFLFTVILFIYLFCYIYVTGFFRIEITFIDVEKFVQEILEIKGI